MMAEKKWSWLSLKYLSCPLLGQNEENHKKLVWIISDSQSEFKTEYFSTFTMSEELVKGGVGGGVYSLTIIYWDWGYRIKLEEKTWVLSVFYSKYIPSASIQRVAWSSKDWNDLCTSSCGIARRLDVTAPWMFWTSSKRRPFNGNFSLGNRK